MTMEKTGNTSAERIRDRPIVVHMKWEADRFSAFFPLLHRGVLLKARQGCSVRSILANQLKMTDDSIRSTIAAVFLDGRPVTEINSVTVKEQSTLAITAFLTEPFLLGAFPHWDGYQRLQSEDTRGTIEPDESSGEIYFRLKLYNIVAKDFGHVILQSGLWLDPVELHDFFASRPESFWMGFKSAYVDNSLVEPSFLLQNSWAQQTGLAWLKVERA